MGKPLSRALLSAPRRTDHSPVPRYILNAGEVEIRTPGGRTREELWIGIETEQPVNLAFLSRCGVDLIPCEGMTEGELRSVGIVSFELIEV